MKIPESEDIIIDAGRGQAIYDSWLKAAADIGLESGIYVAVGWECYPTLGTLPCLKRIYFKVMDHEFENLTELKRAIANKSFL